MERENRKILEYVLEESSGISDGFILGTEHIKGNQEYY